MVKGEGEIVQLRSDEMLSNPLKTKCPIHFEVSGRFPIEDLILRSLNEQSICSDCFTFKVVTHVD